MASVLNRTTKEFRTSVNTPDFPVAQWIINPVLPPGVPTKYFNISGDTVTEMSQGEKDVVDAAEAAAIVTENRAESVASIDLNEGIGFEHRELIELLNTRDNFLTNRVIELQDRVQAMLDSTGGVANMRTDGLAVSISATATRTRADAVQDYKDDINAGTVDN